MKLSKIYHLLLLTFLYVSTNSVFSQNKDSKKLHPDTLTYRRVFLNTRVYQNGSWLSNSKVKTLFKDTSQPRIKFNWGTYMKPIGPVVVIGGVYLAYDAIKGVPASATINGETYSYTIRSLPKLLLGLGLVVGGGSMIESSNELIQHSVEIYNRGENTKKTSSIQKVDFGLTSTNQIGFVMKLR